jgi:hypothetical protein
LSYAWVYTLGPVLLAVIAVSVATLVGATVGIGVLVHGLLLGVAFVAGAPAGLLLLSLDEFPA